MAGRIASWLRRLTEDRGRPERCLECRRRFYGKEPGAWIFGDARCFEFRELCNSQCSRDGRSHTNCAACGPYCPDCATATEQRLLAIREAYGR